MAGAFVLLVAPLLLLLEQAGAQETPPIGNEICLQPPLKGPCRAIRSRWYYDRHSQTCQEFTFGGCEGNSNNFLNRNECYETCKGIKKVPKICRLEADSGICRGLFPKYFFNLKSMSCEKFDYGGCYGNENRFDSRGSCTDFCLPKRIGPSFCYSPKDEGSCSAAVPRFYYNTKTKTCEKFNYTGCGGNNNNFTTEKACIKNCLKKGKRQPIFFRPKKMDVNRKYLSSK